MKFGWLAVCHNKIPVILQNYNFRLFLDTLYFEIPFFRKIKISFMMKLNLFGNPLSLMMNYLDSLSEFLYIYTPAKNKIYITTEISNWYH